MAETIERILQYRHCINRDKTFIGEGKFCSQTCKDIVGDEVKRKLGLIWVAIVAVTTVFVILSLGAGK